MLKKTQGHLVATALAEYSWDAEGTCTAQELALSVPAGLLGLQTGMLTKLDELYHDLEAQVPASILVYCYLADSGYKYEAVVNALC